MRQFPELLIKNVTLCIYNLYLKLPSEIFWKFTNSKDSGMTIMARQPIGKGEPIYHSYAREFTTTTFRRLILFSGILILQNILNYSNNNKIISR